MNLTCTDFHQQRVSPTAPVKWLSLSTSVLLFFVVASVSFACDLPLCASVGQVARRYGVCPRIICLDNEDPG